MAVPIAEWLQPERTALIVIDVQNGFTSDNSTLARRGASMVLARGCIPALNELIRAARSAGVHVVYTQSVHNRELSLPNKFALRGRWEDLPIHDFTWEIELAPALEQPREGDMVIKKYNYDAFSDTPLDLHLRSRGIETCIFTGIETACCVETSARHAYIRGYNVVIASDCCASCGSTVEESRAFHEASLRILAARFGVVMTGREIAATWAQPQASALAGSTGATAE